MAKKNPSDINFQPLFDYMDKKFATKEELNEVKEAVSHLPTKQEFFDRMDKLSGEIQAVRQEQVAHSGQHTRIDDQLQNHEKRLTHLESPPN